jgi:phosphate transport system substrate-binding protein
VLKEDHVKVGLRKRLPLGVAALAIAALTAAPMMAASPNPTIPNGAKGALAGQGATFPSLLYKSWMATFSQQNPGAFDQNGNSANGLVFSYNAIGSGAGKAAFYGSDARKANQLFSASDALLSATDLSSIQSKVGDYQMIPMALGPVAVVYNLPNLRQKVSATSTTTRAATLYLDGPTLGKIYAGTISRWNDPAIKALNPLIVNLPGSQIRPVYRSDGSGTSFIFSTYLLKAGPAFAAALGGKPSQTMADKISTLPSKARAIGAPGNEGVASTVTFQKYSIGYVELGYALQLGMKYAWMRTGDTAHKYFVPPTTSGAQAAAAAAFASGTANPVNPPTSDANTFFQPVNQKGATAYPISGYTWVLLYGDYGIGGQAAPIEDAQAIVAFWQWALTSGQPLMSKLGYAPLPPSVAAQSLAQLHQIKYNGTAIWP